MKLQIEILWKNNNIYFGEIDEEILDNGLSGKEVELLKQLLEEEIKKLDKTKSLRINDDMIRVIVENAKWIY